jgi:alanyl-tRNA synthetase
VRKRLAEIKALHDEVADLRRRLAVGQASELAAGAVDGAVLARIDGPARNDLKDLAVAVRDQPGIELVVLAGAPDGGGAALIGAVTPDAGIEAGALIGPAAAEISGGGGKGKDFAMAGGKDPAGLDRALDVVRSLLNDRQT